MNFRSSVWPAALSRICGFVFAGLLLLTIVAGFQAARPALNRVYQDLLVEIAAKTNSFGCELTDTCAL